MFANNIAPFRIEHALSQQPALCIGGFRHDTSSQNSPFSNENFPKYRAQFLEPEYLSQIDTACEYLRHFEIDKKSGSYGLKHLIERWGADVGLEPYIANGCAILAAILCGYKVVRIRNNPNCRFKRS